MRKLLLTNTLSLGDIVLLTAAVRDLHRAYPGVFTTDVRTTFAELWRNNPWITPLDEYDPEVKVVPCAYPLIRASNQTPAHCLHGFLDFLNCYLGTRLAPAEIRGDIHLSLAEQRARTAVHELAGDDIPYWLIAAGGKYDYTIKWWDSRRYQEVVDRFRGRIQFVQVGDAEHHHPKLRGVVDLRGRTSVRDLVRLVYRAQGVLCGVTGLMHLAAAVPMPGRLSRVRPCVVVAGGREPVQWEAYPGHQFIHTVGALPCCASGGCWKARTRPLNDDNALDGKDHLCVDVRGDLPRCMDLIQAADVARRIESYFEGGATLYLSPAQAKAAVKAAAATASYEPLPQRLSLHNARAAAERFIKTIPPYPRTFAGRGIVICGGGVRLFVNAWVCIRSLRRLGCALPIQLWHLGPNEVDEEMRALLAPLGVGCVDAFELQKRFPARIATGWALKAYALVHCPFEQALFLDADNVPVVNPEFLFETPQFKRTGAVFWPDFNRLAPERPIWDLCGVPWRDEPEFESGQMLIDKARCWAPLKLALWYNENADFFYQHIYGDKDTFHLAFRKLDRPYAMPATPVKSLRGTMCQHDFQGRRIFQHRNFDKWNLFLRNKRVQGFLFEKECRQDVKLLRTQWDGRISRYRPANGSPPPPGPLRIFACMISCAERDAVRARTLRQLERTDWGEPPQIVMDGQRFASCVDNMAHTAWRALQASLQSDAEYVLFLEDDLTFNRHLRHNLEHWAPLRRREVTLASLYNPGVRDWACDVAGNAIVADPQSIIGSQAFLFSRAAVKYLLTHWKDLAAAFDLRAPRLLARLERPIYYHAPSLVQHVGTRSVWGGGFHYAADFSPDWKARD